MIPHLLKTLAVVICAFPLKIAAQSYDFTPVITGLDTPWAVAVTPNDTLLITEKSGQLLSFKDGQKHIVSGTPRVTDRGQGGLLDITLPRDFATSSEVFLTYSKPQRGGGSGTALAIAKLSKDARRLTGLRDIFVSAEGGKTGRHFGSRVVEARDGTLFVTIGDRGDRPSAQDMQSHNGKVIRVARNGSIPQDNPFINTARALPEIWSLGHRNPQGAGLDADGQLWTSEHGARGGDEINKIAKGANFGWPIISYGVHYSGAQIGVGTAQDGLEQPEHYWDPSIAPSGLLVYSGKKWPQLRGQILVGSLKFDYIARLSANQVREVDRIQSSQTQRVRDIIETPDGDILFISAGQGAVYRLDLK